MAVIRKLERPPEENDANSSRLLKRLKRKAKYSQNHDESNWLISYADMMTLLCVFYIMLFSMSKVNTQEFEKVKKQVAEHFGTKYESPTAELGKFVTQVIQESGVAKDVKISSDGISVTLAFQSTLFFGSLSAEISGEGRTIVDRIAHGLAEQQKKIGKNYKIVIEGHTDAQPVLGGPFPSNWELSSSRATRVIRLFLDDGFDAQNLLAIGYGDTQPLADGKNADGTWNAENLAKNRRVVVRVLMPDVDSIPWASKPVLHAEAKPLSPGTKILEGTQGTVPAAPLAPASVAGSAVNAVPEAAKTDGSAQANLNGVAPDVKAAVPGTPAVKASENSGSASASVSAKTAEPAAPTVNVADPAAKTAPGPQVAPASVDSRQLLPIDPIHKQ